MRTTTWIVGMLMVTGTLAAVAYASVSPTAAYAPPKAIETPQERMLASQAGAQNALETLLAEDDAAQICVGCQAAFMLACGGRGSYSCDQYGNCSYSCTTNPLEV